MASHPTLDAFVRQDQDLAKRVGVEVLKHFPEVQYAFSYGSAVMSQDGKKPNIATPKTSLRGSKMMDFIFIVSDPEVWHRKNIRQYSEHYSFLRRMGPGFLESVQRSGAGVYFNPFAVVPITDQALVEELGLGHEKNPELLVKYGVMSADQAAKDLLFWDSLYLAGRMHKPVTVLRGNRLLQTASTYNLHHALSLAILSLPERFSELDLFSAICALSYTGDVRMGVAEDPGKVRNIVTGSIAHFRALYGPLLHHYLHPSGLPFYSPHSPQMIHYTGDNEKKLEDAARTTDPSSVSLRSSSDPTLRSRLITSLPLGLRKQAAQARRPRERLTPEGVKTKSLFLTESASLLPPVSRAEYLENTKLPFHFPGDDEDPVRWDRTFGAALAPISQAGLYLPFLNRFPLFNEIFELPIQASPKIPIPPPSVDQLLDDSIVRPMKMKDLPENELTASPIEDVKRVRENMKEQLRREQIRQDEKFSAQATPSLGAKAALFIVNTVFTPKTNHMRNGTIPSKLDVFKPYLPIVQKESIYNASGMYVEKDVNKYHEAVKTQNAEALQRNLVAATASIVKRSSRAQTIKGFWTAGVTKSVVYAASKLLKAGAKRG